MAQIYDVPRLDFERYPGQRGWCEVRVYLHRANVIAVATEPISERGWYANQGLSITNGIEAVAEVIVNGLGVDFSHLIEHYPPRGHGVARFEEDFARVDFDGPGLRNPRWKHIARAEVEEMIGEAFPVNLTP
ncbi:MAG TPA: hypothetical protein VFY83_10800 [Anaerolineales bacterium]|nr:hypothetical protein [Anaerolineales bacterium]